MHRQFDRRIDRVSFAPTVGNARRPDPVPLIHCTLPAPTPMQPAPTPCHSNGILVQCRPGFEADALLELETSARAARLVGHGEPIDAPGAVLFQIGRASCRERV